MSEDEIPTAARTKSTPHFVRAGSKRRVALDTANYFAERKGRSDLAALKSILTRKGGVAPREGDER